MEYAPFGTLYSLLRNDNIEVGPKQLFDWSRQIAAGMDYLHTGAPVQLIHRDLKSQNVLVCSLFHFSLVPCPFSFSLLFLPPLFMNLIWHLSKSLTNFLLAKGF